MLKIQGLTGKHLGIRFSKDREREMRKFKVDITRTSVQSLEVEIEAENEDEAIEKAHAMSGDLVFSGREKFAECECQILEEIEQ